MAEAAVEMRDGNAGDFGEAFDGESGVFVVGGEPVDVACEVADLAVESGAASIEGSVAGGGVEAAPFADVLWMETKTADLADAKKFADAIHAVYPDQMMAYNLSPSFNWDSTGMSDDDRAYFLSRGLGISNIAHRATAKASELTVDELRTGGEQLRGLVRQLQPRVVAVAGIPAYRSAFREPKAVMGEQPGGFEGQGLWVVPNPSGLNAHETTESLADAYRAAAVAAGVVT